MTNERLTGNSLQNADNYWSYRPTKKELDQVRETKRELEKVRLKLCAKQEKYLKTYKEQVKGETCRNILKNHYREIPPI